MAHSPQTSHLRRTITLPRAVVWQLMAHTDHLNRAIGLPEVSFEAIAEDSGVLFREAQARIAGLKLTYREYPFFWVQNQEYAVRRVFSSGPFAEMYIGLRLRDEDAWSGENRRGGERRSVLTALADLPFGERRRAARRNDEGRNWVKENGAPLQSTAGGIIARQSTAVELFATITPANGAGAKLAAPFAQRSMKQTWAYIQKFCDERERSGSSQPDTLPAPQHAPRIDRALLMSGLRLLKAKAASHRYRALDGHIIDLLGAWLSRRGDDEVASLKPFALARQWGSDADETLRVCLYAVKAGLLNLSWNLMCPNCRVSKADSDLLSGVTSPFHCDMCGINYSANFDRYVELRFRPHPALRPINDTTFCIGGPSISPHALIQSPIEIDGQITLPFPNEENLRLRVLRANHSIEFTDNNDESEIATVDDATVLEYSANGWDIERMTAPRVEMTIHNRSGREILVVLERTEWDSDAVTAARVTALNEFRDLFSSEILAPGQHIGIESLTILFSDLKDSTAMYEEHGDAVAFGRVRSHFDYMFDHVQAHRGAIIKTAGDAVMAVFWSPEDGLRAAFAMQEQLVEFNRSANEGDLGARPIVLKLGLHQGPAIAVTSNERLDYFGRTVNLAARIQDASQGNDIVFSGEVWQRLAVRQLLHERGVHPQHFLANLKGIADVFDLYRIDCAINPKEPR